MLPTCLRKRSLAWRGMAVSIADKYKYLHINLPIGIRKTSCSENIDLLVLCIRFYFPPFYVGRFDDKTAQFIKTIPTFQIGL